MNFTLVILGTTGDLTWRLLILVFIGFVRSGFETGRSLWLRCRNPDL